MTVVKLTKSFIDNANLSKDGRRIFYHGINLPSFMLIVGKTNKTFAVQSAIRGRTVRYTIGRYWRRAIYSARVTKRGAIRRFKATGEKTIPYKKALNEKHTHLGKKITLLLVMLI